MITIILEDKQIHELARVSSPGNEQYLIQDNAAFPLLSDLSDCSYSVFGAQDMEALIKEIESLFPLPDESDHSHVTEIIELAKRCRENSNYVLSFTPCE